jgi:predicted nucleic acid-binding protein
VIYLDSGAVVKLVRQEEHSADLVEWLNVRPDVPLVSSVLAELEVARVLRRSAPQALVAMSGTFGRLFRVEVDATIRATAAAFTEPTLRTLDAIHLATARVLVNESGADLTAFVTYDPRLLASAQAAGMPTVSPGRDRTAWMAHAQPPPAGPGVGAAARVGHEWEHTTGWQLPAG